MHKAHTAHTAHNTHTAHKAHTAQRPSLCPPPTSSVVPTASSDQTPPRRCPPNVSVPDHLYAPSTLYVQWVGPARNRPRRLFVFLRFLSNQPLAILSRSCSQISSTDERNSESRDFFLSLCVYQVIKTWNPQVKTRASQATG